jgi:hypothetical protein
LHPLTFSLLLSLSLSLSSFSSFQRLDVDPMKRKMLLTIVSRLHNLRVRHGQRTHMGTVYANSCLVGTDAVHETDDLDALTRAYAGVSDDDLGEFASWQAELEDESEEDDA